jgi:hypothetical protein
MATRRLRSILAATVPPHGARNSMHRLKMPGSKTVDMNKAVQDLQDIEVEAGIRPAVTVSGALDKQAIVFCNSLAASYGMWDDVTDRVAPHACLTRYDARGHGRSDAPEGGYAIETLVRDVRADGDGARCLHRGVKNGYKCVQFGLVWSVHVRV